MEMRKLLGTLVLTLLAYSCCFAQTGAMALTGRVRDLKVENDTVSFRFSGHISFPIIGKSDGTWNINVEDVVIKISKFDTASDSPNENIAPAIPLNKISTYLKERNETQKTAVLGLASPVVYFSDWCAITKIETKKIVVVG